MTAFHLGQIVLQHRGSQTPRPTAQIIVALCLGAAGIWFIFEEKAINLSAVLCFLVGFIVFDAWRYGRAKAIECYENGLSIKHWRRVKNIACQEISAARYKAVHEHINGLYIVTKVTFEVMTTDRKIHSIDIGCNKKAAEDIWGMVELTRSKNPKVRLINK